MNKVYQIVTDRVIKMIEDAIKNNDVLPWQKPWTGNSVPLRWKPNTPYRGVNLFLLPPGEYITRNQINEEWIKDKSVHLKAGAKEYFAVFWKLERKVEEDEDGNKSVRVKPILRYYNVFNICDVEGIKPRRNAEEFTHQPIEEAEEIVNSYISREKIKLYFEGSSAFYRPATDEIHVPEMSHFPKLEEFYSTLFHEMTHSTGAKSRLNRLEPGAFFGSEDYSKEELVAEMGASMLCGRVGIVDRTVDNSAAYLQNWLSAIKKSDPTMLVYSAARAQKAVDFITGEKWEE